MGILSQTQYQWQHYTIQIKMNITRIFPSIQGRLWPNLCYSYEDNGIQGTIENCVLLQYWHQLDRCENSFFL